MSPGLQIADGLWLPLDAVTETFGVLAKRGSGKTYTAKVMAEEMHAAGLPFVAVDPVGVWYGLRSSAGLLAKLSPTSSGYGNNLGAMRSAGLIDYPRGRVVVLTDEGRANANAPASPPTNEDLWRTLEDRLSSSQWRLLQVLIDLYPEALSRDELAEKAEQSPTSSGYGNNLGALRSLGFLDYPTPGWVMALPVLFLEGDSAGIGAR